MNGYCLKIGVGNVFHFVFYVSSAVDRTGSD